MTLRGSAEPRVLGLVAALSLAGIAPMFLLDIGAQAFIGGDIVSTAVSLVPLLVLLPLPAAYVATVSRHRFRVETFGAAVTLPLALLGTRFAALSVGLVLGLLLVSYKARSIYNGDNQFWTFFKASAALMTVLAIVLGLTAAYTYDTSANLREDVQGNLTEQGVETATQFIDLSQQGLSTDSLTGAATALAENVSRTSITMTETIVFQEVAQDGSFTDEQEQVLRSAFARSEREIPSQIRDQADRRVANQVNGDGGSQVEEELIASRAAPMIERFTRPTPPVLALIFLSILSIVYILKVPVGLLGGVYGKGIYWLEKRRESDAQDDGPRENGA